MTIPNINVHPGRDPAVLRDSQAVSGFEGWTAAEQDALCGCIREECVRVLEVAPDEIKDAFASGVNLPVYSVPGTDDPALVRFSDVAKLNVEIDAGNRQAAVIGYSPPVLDGLLLQIKRGEDVNALRRKFGHECLHLLTMLAAHPYQSAPWEAMVIRLEKELYGPRPQETIWDPAGFASTTGLAPTEFATVDFDAVSGRAMYHSAHAALDGLRAEQVWKVLGTLTAKTRAGGKMPRMAGIRDAFRAEAQEAGDTAMKTPPFTEMCEGPQHMVFAAKQGGVRVFSFMVSGNPGHGGWLSLDRQDVRFTCRAMQGRAKETLYTRDGSPLPPALGLTMTPSVDLTFDNLAAQLGGRVPELGDTIGVTLGTLPEIRLQRKKA